MAVVPYAAIRKLKLGQTLSSRDVRLLRTMNAIRHAAVRQAPKA